MSPPRLVTLWLAAALAGARAQTSLSLSISAAPPAGVNLATGEINATYAGLCSSHPLCVDLPTATGDASCCPGASGERQECCLDDFEFRQRVCAQPYDWCTGEADGGRWTTCCTEGHRCADTSFSSERMCVPEALQRVGENCFPLCNHMYGSCEVCGVGAACCHAPHSDHRPECANTTQVITELAGGRVAVCVMQTIPVELDHRDGMDCWQACGNQAGSCQWCGEGNACCREGWAEQGRDPPECRGTGNFTRRRGHECVRQREPAAVLHMGTPCWDQCGGHPGSCDWCGTGNACCREGWAGRSISRWHRGVEYVTSGDPPECANAIGHEHPWRHECVQPTNVPTLLHRGQDCWNHCGSGDQASTRSGLCDWCGVGNLCCRQGHAGDNPICGEAVGFSTPWQHECVGFPEPLTTTPGPTPFGTTIFQANQTQGGFVVLFAVRMHVPTTSVDHFELQETATSIAAAVAQHLQDTPPELVQVLRVSISEDASTALEDSIIIVIDLIVGCGDQDGQVATLVRVQGLHTPQNAADLEAQLASALGLTGLHGLRVLGVELPTGTETSPGDMLNLYPADSTDAGGGSGIPENAQDYTEDIADPTTSEERSGGHLGNFTPAHPVVVDFQVQWPASEASASHYANVTVVLALQESLAVALAVQAQQVRIAAVMWSSSLGAVIVEATFIATSAEELQRVPFSIAALAGSFAFGTEVAERTGLPAPSNITTRVEGSGAESPAEIPPNLEPGVAPNALPPGVGTATPTMPPSPIVATTATPANAASAGGVPPLPLFTDPAPAPSPGSLAIESSFYMDVPAEEASHYGSENVVGILEDSISHTLSTGDASNSVPVQVTYVGPVGASTGRRLTEGTHTLVVNFTAQCSTPDAQSHALARAQQLGDPTTDSTAAFAEHFSSQAGGAGLTPIEPASMAPGSTTTASQPPPPPPPPPPAHSVPMAASASLGVFAVAGGALVLALCLFAAARRNKRFASRPDSARECLSGSDSESGTPLPTPRALSTPASSPPATTRGPTIPEWMMSRPKLPFPTGSPPPYSTLPNPPGSLRNMGLSQGSESHRTASSRSVSTQGRAF